MKNFIFTLIALLVVPIGFFLALEQTLKLAGVGHSRSYFKEIEINGVLHYQDNPFFIEQFYPRSLGITPIANTFSGQPNADRLRVFVLGGSAARGFPNPNHGFSRHLEVMLKAALPLKKIEVVNTAMTSVNSHVIFETAQSIPGTPSDFAIILVGNNEVVGPYGPGTFNQNFLSNLSYIRLLQAIKRSRIWQALEGISSEFQSRTAKEELRWRGMQMFTENTITHDDPRLKRVYDHYQQNLSETIKTLQDQGVQVILSSVPVNLRDSAPFASEHRPDFSPEQIRQWQTAIERGDLKMKGRAFSAAITDFESALTIDPDFASTHFKLAVCYEKLGDFKRAKTHFELARDRDALRFRADSSLNDVVETVATRFQSPSFHYVDSAASFGALSAPNVPGWNLLLEHVHFDFAGNYQLASEFSKVIVKTFEPKASGVTLPKTEVAAQIGYPNHGTIDAMGRLLDMVQAPPFTGQTNHSALVAFIDRKGSQLSQALGSIPAVIDRRQKLIQAGQADWRIDFELAELFEYQKNAPAAFHHLEKVVSAYPHHRGSRMKMAAMLQSTDRLDEAILQLNQALQYSRGDGALQAQTMGLLGMTHFKNRAPEKATTVLTDLIANHSDQIDPTLKAYGTLIRYAVSEGRQSDLSDYVREIQRYGNQLLREGEAERYPQLRLRISQILRLGGRHKEAQQWRSSGGGSAS